MLSRNVFKYFTSGDDNETTTRWYPSGTTFFLGVTDVSYILLNIAVSLAIFILVLKTHRIRNRLMSLIKTSVRKRQRFKTVNQDNKVKKDSNSFFLIKMVFCKHCTFCTRKSRYFYFWDKLFLCQNMCTVYTHLTSTNIIS